MELKGSRQVNAQIRQRICLTKIRGQLAIFAQRIIAVGCLVVFGVTSQSAYATGSNVIWWGYDYVVPAPAALTNVVSIVSELALKADGSLVSWGDNSFGERNIPAGLTNVVAIAGGDAHRLALKGDGKVVAWGAGTNSSSSYPHHGQSIVPVGLSNVMAIAAGGTHSLALRSNGTVVAWGFNFHGQTNVPPNLSNVVSIAAGSLYSLALRADGRVFAWGDGSNGQIYHLASLSNVVAIAAGAFHWLALKPDGSVIPWGANTWGQKDLPPGLSGVSKISAGRVHNLALKSNETVVAWGGGFFGQTNVPWGLTNVSAIFTGDYQNYAINDGTPALLKLPTDRATYTGYGHTFDVTATGVPPFSYQWRFNGTNISGATNSFLSFLNLQTSKSGHYSVVVSNAYGFVISPAATLLVTESPPFIVDPPVEQIVTPGWYGLELSFYAQGAIPMSYQWRLNGDPIPGELWQRLILNDVQLTNAGDYDVVLSNSFGAVTSSVARVTVVPSPIVAWGERSYANNIPPGWSNMMAIACGDSHAVALKDNGTVLAWGHSDYTNIPTDLSNVVAIAAGYVHSLALQSNGTVASWGYPLFTRVPAGLSNVVAIAGGGSHSLALKNDGRVVAWGYFTEVTNLPPGLSNVVAIAAGAQHALALKSDGTVVTWPEGFAPWPNGPNGPSNVVSISAGEHGSVAIKDDGTVVAWHAPAGLSNVVAVAAAGSYYGTLSVALRSDGSVVAWGGDNPGTNVPSGLTNVMAIAAYGARGLALLGTNPPVIRGAVVNPTYSGGRFSTEIPSQSGRVYRLEYKTSLADANWIPLPLVAGNGGTLTLTDPAADLSTRFYRVRRW